MSAWPVCQPCSQTTWLLICREWMSRSLRVVVLPQTRCYGKMVPIRALGDKPEHREEEDRQVSSAQRLSRPNMRLVEGQGDGRSLSTRYKSTPERESLTMRLLMLNRPTRLLHILSSEFRRRQCQRATLMASESQKTLRSVDHTRQL